MPGDGIALGPVEGGQAVLPLCDAVGVDRIREHVFSVAFGGGLRETLRRRRSNLADIVRVLREALGDEREGVALYAAMALGRTGPAMAPAVPALLEALADPRALLRGNAASALSQGGPVAFEALRRALEADDGTRAEMLTWALRLRGEEAAAVLEAAAKRPEDRVAVHAALRLWELDHDDAAAVERLVARLASDDEAAVLQAVRGLGRIGPPARRALPALDQAEARLAPDGELRDLLERALAGTRAQIGP